MDGTLQVPRCAERDVDETVQARRLTHTGPLGPSERLVDSQDFPAREDGPVKSRNIGEMPVEAAAGHAEPLGKGFGAQRLMPDDPEDLQGLLSQQARLRRRSRSIHSCIDESARREQDNIHHCMAVAMAALLVPAGLLCIGVACLHGYLGKTRLIARSTFPGRQAGGLISAIWLNASTPFWSRVGFRVAEAAPGLTPYGAEAVFMPWQP